jgi:L-amino acid N-acyltransferase YncA
VEKTVKLRNDQRVLIRHMRPDDVQASFDFFKLLSHQDRQYLRVDVTKWEFVDARVRQIDPKRVQRLVAVDGDRIVGDAALEIAGHGWGDRIAEIRVIIASEFQRTGLGTALTLELLRLATEHEIDRIVARMMWPQKGARLMLQSLGFKEEFLVPAMVRDQGGQWQDMIIMRCSLEDLLREVKMASYLENP